MTLATSTIPSTFLVLAAVAALTGSATAQSPCYSGSHLAVYGPWLFLPSSVQIMNGPALETPTGVTIDLRMNATSAQNTRVVSRGDGVSAVTQRCYDLTLRLDGKVQADFFFGPVGTDAWASAVSQAVISPGQWRRVTASFDSASGEVRLYVDGVIQAITVQTTGGLPIAGMTLRPSSHSIAIGSTPNLPETSFVGGIDEARIWNRALTVSEVLATAAAELDVQNGLVAWLPFDGHVQDLAGQHPTLMIGTCSIEGDCAAKKSYGSAVGGPSGAPAVTLNANPVLGNSATLHVSNPQGTSLLALLVLGTAPTKVKAFGGHLLVQPITTTVMDFPYPSVSMPFPLPQDPTLAGVPVFMQVFVPQAGAPGGVGVSRGLELEFGY